MPRVLTSMLVMAVSCGPELGAEPNVAESREALTQVSSFGSNPGSLTLWLHEPSNLPASPALVVALHGCTQSASAYEAAGWNALADQNGFIVAYPQTTAGNDCFDWFDSAQQARAGTQVTSILQMVTYLEQNKSVDATRVFVSGLSAGGAMTNVLLAVAPDVFSRGAVMAGLPFACSTNQTDAFTCMNSPPDKTPAQWGALVRAAAGGHAAPRVSLWHGASDTTVQPGNLAEERDQWADVNGIDVTADAVTTVGRATRSEYRDGSGTTLVETWSVSGMNHGTPVDPANGCGTAGAFILDVGVCSSRWAAAFFGLATPPTSGTGGGSGGGASSGTGGGTSGAGGGSTGPCTNWFDTNVNHFTAGRAVLCNGRYCAKGSGDLLGDSLDQTWVKQTVPMVFNAGQCATSGAGGGGAQSGTGGGTQSGTGGGGGGAQSSTGGGAQSGAGGGSAQGAAGGTMSAAGGGSSDESPHGCGCGSGGGLPLGVLALGLLRATKKPTSA